MCGYAQAMQPSWGGNRGVGTSRGESMCVRALEWKLGVED